MVKSRARVYNKAVSAEFVIADACDMAGQGVVCIQLVLKGVGHSDVFHCKRPVTGDSKDSPSFSCNLSVTIAYFENRVISGFTEWNTKQCQFLVVSARPKLWKSWAFIFVLGAKSNFLMAKCRE